MNRLLLAAALLAAGLLAGCRGMESGNPPIHPNLNMDFQEKFQEQEANPFFADNKAMRTPPLGTVARGMLQAESGYFQGRTAGGGYVEALPVTIDEALLRRGQDRYEVYCAVCHGQAGDGQGPVGRGGYGWIVPSYHTDRLRSIEDGYIYDVIANGYNTMPGYAQQIPVADRWAIVAYFRALQESQYAPEGELTPGELQQARRRSTASGGAEAAPSN